MIFDVVMLGLTMITSDSGTWPSVDDGTEMRLSTDGSSRNRSAARRYTRC
jgi:hypothetical protein